MSAVFAGPLVELMRQLSELLDGLSDAGYVAKPVGPIESSIGAHVRHCLDHVRTLATAGGASQGPCELDYDTRARNTRIETDRTVALEEIAGLQRQLAAMPRSCEHKSVDLKVLMTSDGEPMAVKSTVAREAAFVLSHTIHHNAIIGAMVKLLGGKLPDRFGYAPATIKALKTN